MDVTSCLLPAPQQMKDEDCKAFVKRDNTFLEEDVREVPLNMDIAKNSTSFNRRFTKAGVDCVKWGSRVGARRYPQPADASRRTHADREDGNHNRGHKGGINRFLPLYEERHVASSVHRTELFSR